MARPPLILGTWGNIKRSATKNAAGNYTAYARFRDYDGVTRQVKKDGPTPAQAERNLIEVLKERSHLPSENLTRESTIAALAEAWLSDFDTSEAAMSTKAAYRHALERHVLPAMGKVRLREATVPYIDRFITTIRKTSGAATAKRSKVVLSHLFSLAVRHGAVAANPVRDVAAVKTKKKAVRAISVEDVRTLRAQLREWEAGKYANGHDRNSDIADAVDVFLGTGMRTGELFAITYSSIDFDSAPPTVIVSATVVFEVGRGYYVQNHPKSDDSRRTLTLPSFAADALRRRQASAVTDLVFPSARLTLRTPANFRRQWRDFRDAYGYEEWITPKTFRKAVATLLSDELGLERAADQLGHAGTTVTREHYRERPRVVADSAEVLERFAS